jgi:hypothetical protein
MKKILLMLVVCVLCISSTVLAGNVNVQLNGKNVDFTDNEGNKVEAQIINSRTMVPMRKIFELLGASIEWNGGNQTVLATKDDISIKLQIGNEIAEVIRAGKTEKVKLDSMPVIVNNRTLVPLRFISESLEKQVGWDAQNQTAIIIDYDYFLEKIKSSTPNLYKALTTMPVQGATIQITRNYNDLTNSANNTTSTVYATVSQKSKNEQNISIDFSGNSLLFKEIVEEGWGSIALDVAYDDDGITYNTNSSVLSKMLDSNRKTYKELGLTGKYNMSFSELAKELLKIDENNLDVNSFGKIREEYDNFLKLFSFSETGGVSNIKAGAIKYSNANNVYIDYTKFDNIIVENEFFQVYNLINKLLFNYDVTLNELLYDTSNISFELTSQNQGENMITNITIKLQNDYNELYTYVIKINKK